MARHTSLSIHRELRGFTNRTLCAIWDRLSEYYGLPPLVRAAVYSPHWSPEFINNDLKELRPPLVYTNAAGTIWVDRYYVAFDLGEQGYQYAAVSWYEANEEMKRLREGTRRKLVLGSMPEPARSQLINAVLFFRHTGERLWLNSELAPLRGLIITKGRDTRGGARQGCSVQGL